MIVGDTGKLEVSNSDTGKEKKVDDRGMILHEGDFEIYLFGSYTE
jgi:hypothetical protein